MWNMTWKRKKIFDSPLPGVSGWPVFLPAHVLPLHPLLNHDVFPILGLSQSFLSFSSPSLSPSRTTGALNPSHCLSPRPCFNLSGSVPFCTFFFLRAVPLPPVAAAQSFSYSPTQNQMLLFWFLETHILHLKQFIHVLCWIFYISINGVKKGGEGGYHKISYHPGLRSVCM